MNIATKAQLFAALARVLRPGGRLAFHEVMAGSDTPVLFPVPWAAEGHLSVLSPPQGIRSLLARAGWKEPASVDKTADALTFFRERLALAERPAEDLPALGLHLLLGDTFSAAFGNMVRNLKERRITVVQAVRAALARRLGAQTAGIHRVASRGPTARAAERRRAAR